MFETSTQLFLDKAYEILLAYMVLNFVFLVMILLLCGITTYRMRHQQRQESKQISKSRPRHNHIGAPQPT